MRITSLLILVGLGLSLCKTLEAAQLIVTPQACATSADELPCIFDVSVTYVGEIKQDLCLWLKHESKPHRCYSESKQLNEQLSLALAEDTQIEIRDSNSRVLISAQLSVALFKPPVKPTLRGLNWELL